MTTDKDLDELVRQLRDIAKDGQRQGKTAGAAIATQADEAITALREDKARLEDGLRRLASPEAFLLAKVANSEERLRMFFADAILTGASVDEAVDYARQALKEPTP